MGLERLGLRRPRLLKECIIYFDTFYSLSIFLFQVALLIAFPAHVVVRWCAISWR